MLVQQEKSEKRKKLRQFDFVSEKDVLLQPQFKRCRSGGIGRRVGLKNR